MLFFTSKKLSRLLQNAREGKQDAQTAMGYIYEQQGASSKAVDCYKKAKEAGSALASNNLGLCYWYGRGVSKDSSKAIGLLEEAANAGLPLAHYNLAIILLENADLKLQESAFEHAKIAYEEKVPASSYLLAELYSKGIGCELDEVSAYLMFKKAVDENIKENCLSERELRRCQEYLSSHSPVKEAVSEYALLFRTNEHPVSQAILDVFKGKKGAGHLLLSGPALSGKTSLFHQVSESQLATYGLDLSKSTLITIQLQTIQNYEELWAQLCSKFKEKLKEKGIDTEENEKGPANFQQVIKYNKTLIDEAWNLVLVFDGLEQLKNIFSQSGDEFIRFASLFQGEFSNRGILLSRSSLAELEQALCPGFAPLSKTFSTIVLRHLEERDIQVILEREFPDLLKQRIEKELEESESELAEDLYYFTGGQVSLLDVYLRELASQSAFMPISEIYQEQSLSIHSIYQVMKNWMKEEGIFDEVLEIMLDPYIRLDRGKILDLRNLDRIVLRDDMRENFVYCPHFSRILQREPIRLPLIQKVLDTERNIKNMIRAESAEIYGTDEWQKKEKRFTNDFNNLNWDLYEKFMVDEKKFNPENYSYLNVISLFDSIKIVERYWIDHFSSYFHQEAWDLWKEDFKLCASKRNPLAHGQEERLTDRERQNISRACDRINRSILSVIGPGGSLPAAIEEVPLGRKVYFYPKGKSKFGGIRGYFFYGEARIRAITPVESLSGFTDEERQKMEKKRFLAEVEGKSAKGAVYIVSPINEKNEAESWKKRKKN